ncbi:ABC transporter ATP-binding protein [Pseudarthrobacter sp. NPDC092419]|uniref:ABC transporter ATP-binding protein n=1 Tax=Pseudarthrobacter sp. NPDC092419 TaxID=3364414 RepID=UPI0037F9FD05
MDLPDPLQVAELTKIYGSRPGIENLSFTVGAGQITGLLGPNGSGKSTTIHCITGFIKASSGRILLGGAAHHSVEAKDRFGFFPDDLPMPDSLTGSETIAFYRRLRPLFSDATADGLVELLGLSAHLGKYVGEYSHGMKRKLQLVVALAHRPELLILDEPMRGLDPEAGLLMNALLRTFTEEGGAVLLATHDLTAAERVCGSVVILAQGRMVAAGAPGDLMARHGTASLEELFVHATGLHTAMLGKELELQRLLQLP